MPKDKVDEPKKKVLVVEEIESSDELQSETLPQEDGENRSQPSASMTNVKLTEENKSQPDSNDDFDEYDKPNYLWIIVPTALLVGALAGGLITYFSAVSKMGSTDNTIATPVSVATSTPSADSESTASPSSNFKKEDLKIQILNGSGLSGAAGKAKTVLEGLGYKNIDTGNATSSDFSETEVAIKESKKDYLDLIIKDLSKSYEATEAAKPLSSTSKFDIVITLGKK